MRLTLHTDYALRLLMDIAVKPDGPAMEADFHRVEWRTVAASARPAA